jgi:hypothetical protein
VTRLVKVAYGVGADETRGTGDEWLMAGLGFEMVRYADDMVVLCRSREEAESALGGIDGWIRMRLRSILRKRRGLRGRGRGKDHQRWPNRYFTKLGLFCLLDARESTYASLRKGANH